MDRIGEQCRAFREQQVRRMRDVSPSAKFVAGPRLFDRAVCVMTDGIRDELSGADADTVQRILKARLAIARHLDEE